MIYEQAKVTEILEVIGGMPMNEMVGLLMGVMLSQIIALAPQQADIVVQSIADNLVFFHKDALAMQQYTGRPN